MQLAMETWEHVLLKKLTRFYITPLDSRNYTNPTKCPPKLANSNCFKYRNHIINYNTYHSSVFKKCNKIKDSQDTRN